MPEISRFFGVVICMFPGDHRPPHFPAYYGEYEMLVELHTLAAIQGKLPPRVRGMVVEWAALHQEELLAMWERGEQQKPLGRIAPLP